MDDLHAADEAVALPLPADDRRTFTPMRLILMPGGQKVEMMRPDVLVGRHSEADIRLRMPDVSRRHCRFLFADGQWRIMDLNSLNGVYVNGEPVTDTILHDKDQVRIGAFTFEVNIDSLPATLPLPLNPKSPERILGSIAGALPPPERKRQAS